MSAGGYDAPHPPSSYSSYGPRRGSGIAAAYDRSSNGPVRRTSPSPATRRFSFGGPHRGAPPYQNDYSYRPSGANSYRPNNKYYSRSPSPDRHGLSRSADSDSRDRHGSWQSAGKQSSWPERKVVTPSPTSSTPHERSRSGDDIIATRMFEPSDAWKQTHINRPRGDSYRSDRRYDYRNRKDESPDRLRPDNGSFYSAGNDRIRPTPPKWDSRNDYNSNRSYEGGGSWTPREPLSPSGSYRRESLPASQSRFSDHYEPSYNDRRISSRSATGSVSPRSRARTPPDRRGRLGRSPSRDRSYYSAYDSDSTNYRRSPRRRRSRSSSRSSIASSVNTNPHLSASRPEPVVPDSDSTRARGSSVHSVSSQHAVPKIDSTLSGPSTRDTTKPESNAFSGSSTLPDTLVKPNDSLPKLTIFESQQVLSSQTNGKTDQSLLASANSTQMSNSIPARPTIFPSVSPSPALATSALATSALSNSVQAFSPPLPIVSSSHLSHSPPNFNASPETLDSPKKVDTTSSESVTPMVVDDPSPNTLPPSSPLQAIDSSSSPGNNISDDAVPMVQDGPPETPDSSETRATPLPTELPQLSEARSLKEALRIVVMQRLMCDRQPRQERVDPILMANLTIAAEPEVDTDSTPEQVIQEVCSGDRVEKRNRTFRDLKPAMIEHFRRRQALISGKADELKEEYISLQQLWNDHRAALNLQNKALAAEQEQIHHTGRTTRRTATLGDAVRSDLEMEQIIASLGYDEATDPSILCLRNVATIPDMISVTHGKIDYYFDDTNNRVDNPSEYYAPETGMHDWTEEEKETFISQFAAHPKQFGIIADYLPNKTPAQCVSFYYLHKHKHIDFRKVVSTLGPNKRRRKGGGKKKSNALLTDIAQHDEQVGRDGAASPAGGRPKRGRKQNPDKPTSSKKPASAVPPGLDDIPTAATTPEPDVKPKRGRGRPPGSGKKAAAAAAAAAQMAAVSVTGTPITPNITLDTPAATPTPVAPTPSSSKGSPREDMDQEMDSDDRPTKRTKRVRQVKSAAIIDDDDVGTSTTGSPAPSAANTPGVGESMPMDTISNANHQAERIQIAATESTIPPSIRWTEEDKKLFISLLEQHGTDFEKIAAYMPRQTSTQISLYYKRNQENLGLENIASRAPKSAKSLGSMPVPVSSAAVIKSVGRIPKVKTSSTSGTDPKRKEDEVPPMGSLTPPSVTASTSTSSQESKLPEILKGWGSIMSRERPPPPSKRHPKPKNTSRRPQSMSEVHSPSSSPPPSNASLPSTPVASSSVTVAPAALPASLIPRPASNISVKPLPPTSTGASRHYPTANYVSATASTMPTGISKSTVPVIPVAVTAAAASANPSTIPLSRTSHPSGYSSPGSGPTSYQASATSVYPPRPSPYVYAYGEPRYPPVFGPPPPPRPPFTATSSSSGTGATGQKDGQTNYPVYPSGGSYYYPSSS